jgi:hypothetical protein
MVNPVVRLQPHHRINHTVTTITLARSNNALPDDGDCTETCFSFRVATCATYIMVTLH